MKKQAYILTLFVLLINLKLSDGIWCFVCHTDTDPNCGDDFRISTGNAEKRQPCPAGSCMKRRGKRKRGSVSRTEIQRSCRLYGQEGCYQEMFNGISQYTCLCNSDFCNTSPTSLPKQSMVVAATGLAVAAIQFLSL